MAKMPTVPEMTETLAQAQENWRIVLEGMEGMVAEAVRRGYTDREARAMVARVMSQPVEQTDD